MTEDLSGRAGLQTTRTEQRDPEYGGLPAGPETEQVEASGKAASLWSDAWRTLRRDPIFIVCSLLILTFAVMAAAPQLFTSADPGNCLLPRSPRFVDELVNPSGGRPTGENIFGFDLQGCDYFARVVYGARVSMLVGVFTVGGSVLLALILGCLAGYYGGGTDSVLGRITDVFFAIPLTLGAIVMLNSVFDTRGVGQVVLVLVLFGWPTMMRLTRSAVLSAKEEDYVTAARALGAGDWRILTRHILPNSIAPVIVYATISIGAAIAAEATLSFLGVGLQLPAISWGLMISVAQSQIQTIPHLLLFPGAFLSVMILSFIMLGDSLRDALDPKLR